MTMRTVNNGAAMVTATIAAAAKWLDIFLSDRATDDGFIINY